MMNVVYDQPWTPRVTLSLERNVYTATLEVDGMNPQRDTTAEERSAGIKSLQPPTVQVRKRSKDSVNHRLLIDLGFRALAAAVENTDPGTAGPGGLLMVKLRSSLAMRGAIRLLGEDI